MRIEHMLLNKLRMFEAELRARCAKFGVSSLEEMEELVRRGEVDEDAILEDFQNVDYLTARISRIKELLEDLGLDPQSSTERSRVSRALQHLEDLGLVQRVWRGRTRSIHVTELGKLYAEVLRELSPRSEL